MTNLTHPNATTFAVAPVMSGANITAATIPTSSVAAGFASLASTQTFSGTNTFNAAPNVPAVNNNATVTHVVGGVAGDLYWSMPETGTGYKSVVIALVGFNGSTTITFPTPFVYSNQSSSGLTTFLSNTQATVTAAGTTQAVIIYGI